MPLAHRVEAGFVAYLTRWTEMNLFSHIHHFLYLVDRQVVGTSPAVAVVQNEVADHRLLGREERRDL